MTDSQQQPQKQTDAWTRLQAAASAYRQEGYAPPAPPPPTEAEIQEALQQVRTHDYSLTGILASFRDLSFSRPPARPMPVDVEALLAILRQESRKRARRMRLSRWGALLSLVSGLFLPTFMHDHSLLFPLCIWIPASLLGMGAQASPKQKAAALAITRFDDARAVGPLVEASEFSDRYIQPIARRSLLRLLPQLKASDAPILNSTHRSNLNKFFRGSNTELILAVLKAWEQVGDSGAITDVQNLAEGRGYNHNPKIMQAASACLPFLRQSAERQESSAQLLRASDGELTPADALLRPVQAHSTTEPADQLLRPDNDAV